MKFITYIFTEPKQRVKVYGSLLIFGISYLVCYFNDYSLLYAAIPHILVSLAIAKGCWENFNGNQW
jgi:hypothetical protein